MMGKHTVTKNGILDVSDSTFTKIEDNTGKPCGLSCKRDVLFTEL